MWEEINRTMSPKGSQPILMEVDATEFGKDSVACCRFPPLKDSTDVVERFGTRGMFQCSWKGEDYGDSDWVVTGSDGVAL
jgi:hypothetical protein